MKNKAFVANIFTTNNRQTNQRTIVSVLCSHSAEQQMALRAGIILDWLDGATYDESTKKRNVSRHGIATWRKRFKAKGLKGLRDKQRPGKPPTITISQRKGWFILLVVSPRAGGKGEARAK